MKNGYQDALAEQRLRSLKKRMFVSLPTTPVKAALHICAVLAYDNQHFSLKILRGECSELNEQKKG